MGKLTQKYCGTFAQIRARNRDAHLIRGVENVDKFAERLARQRPDLTNLASIGFDNLLVREKGGKVVAIWGFSSSGCGQNPTERCLEDHATYCVVGL